MERDRVLLSHLHRLFATLVITFLALPSGASEDPLALDPRCENDDFAVVCFQTCKDRCRSDRAFLMANRDLCLRVPNKSEPSKCQGDAALPADSTLTLCLERERTVGTMKEKLDAVARISPELHNEVTELLAGLPTCAPDVPSLKAMYDCLQREGVSIGNGYSSLQEVGYKKMTDPSELCKIPAEKISKDFELTRTLQERATVLSDEFDEIGKCKAKFEEWSAQKVLERAQGTAGGLIERLITKFQSDLKDAAELEKELTVLLEEIKEDKRSISESMAIALIGCR